MSKSRSEKWEIEKSKKHDDIGMEIDVQPVVGGNIIITFGRVDVELTRNQAERLKILLIEALEKSEREPFLRGDYKRKTFL
ncbi:MAG: hypothetical protein ACXQTS_07320 [Candidatus Methanospirareceae archaeon]